MKNYTAIYDTDTMTNVGYSFKAENLEKALEFCKMKFSVHVKKIIESETWYQDEKGKDIIVWQRK